MKNNKKAHLIALYGIVSLSLLFNLLTFAYLPESEEIVNWKKLEATNFKVFYPREWHINIIHGGTVEFLSIFGSEIWIISEGELDKEETPGSYLTSIAHQAEQDGILPYLQNRKIELTEIHGDQALKIRGSSDKRFFGQEREVEVLFFTHERNKFRVQIFGADNPTDMAYYVQMLQTFRTQGS